MASPALTEFLGSARFNSALALAAVSATFSTNAIRSTMGWAGLIGVLATLVVLAAMSFVAQRREIEWHGLLPISLIVFVGFSALSAVWSSYQVSTAAGATYQLMVAFLGIYIAMVRDAIQIVRVVGDALRFLLTLSLALEVLSGLLIDLPIKFLGIQGNIAAGGPIQGIFGTRNQLSIVALIAFVTFVVEWRTRSVRPPITVVSITIAVLCLLFTHSPVIAAVSVFVGLATLGLFWLRKRPPAARRIWQWAFAAATLVLLVGAYVYRTRVVDLLNARADFLVRYDLWIQIWQLIPMNQIVGWGWVGSWPVDQYPFSALDTLTGSGHTNALNAYLDIYFQLGIIGLILFAALLGLAFVRSWLLASNKHSVVYVWAPLVLVSLLVTAVFESSILVESGWLLVVVCSVKASQGLSWRRRLPPEPAPAVTRPEAHP